ncbi:MAG: UvrD-helicase domain-containing protein [Planctomycetes bacterium]|nr:UvrD-helicase domain-containing protein [Planctomycetota bacterium]
MISPENDAILSPLNPQQREAVLHENGPLLVIAGAGSGKTRAITYRIANLYRRGYSPQSVLAITFTNKAAREMRQRTADLCGIESNWISTFHSLGARLLRAHIRRLEPYDSSFSIYDPSDCKSLLKEILAAHSVDRALATPDGILSDISRLKNSKSEISKPEKDGPAYYDRILYEIFHAYLDEMRKRNAVDFDDLLLLSVKLFEEHQDLLERYQDQFRQILVDEYQDTNAIQFRMMSLLAERHHNICVTGDPDQSIYGWRGADLTNILQFEKQFPNVRVVKLEQNYRSTKNVLHTANALITHNIDRPSKDLWTENESGEPVRVYRFADEQEEAAGVAALVDDLRFQDIALKEIAVFYRVNALSRSLEQQLLLRDIPYNVVGGVEFYGRKEIRDVLAYLQLLVNPRDSESVKRVINTPSRGIGKATISKLAVHAEQESKPLLEVICSTDRSYLGKRAADCVGRFAALYERLSSALSESVQHAVEAVVEATAYRDYLEEQYSGDYEDRLRNLDELVSAAKEFDETNTDSGLQGFLEQTRLYSSVDRWDGSEDRLALMTLHSAKGLEFSFAIILGVEEGLLPLLRRDSDSPPDIEEERRLAYVGVTRAEEALYLTHVARRMRAGESRQAFPSRFVREMLGSAKEGTPAHVELDEATWASLVERSSPEDSLGRSSDRDFDSEDDSWDADWGETYSDTNPAEEFPIGARVYHDDYGEGEICRVHRVGRRLSVTIEFDAAGKKQIFPDFSPLRRIR